MIDESGQSSGFGVVALETPMVTEKMIEALKPLADAVFYDNGDMSFQIPRITSEDCIKAYFAVRQLKSALSTDAEPVGWFNPWNDYHGYQQVAKEFEGTSGKIPLYAAPPAAPVAVKAKLIAELREMAASITYAAEPSRVMKEAAAALTAQVQDVAIPDGWQLVPKYADVEMENAAFEKVRPYHDISERDWRSKMPKDLFRLAWPSMLAAAPAAKLEEKP